MAPVVCSYYIYYVYKNTMPPPPLKNGARGILQPGMSVHDWVHECKSASVRSENLVYTIYPQMCWWVLMSKGKGQGLNRHNNPKTCEHRITKTDIGNFAHFRSQM